MKLVQTLFQRHCQSDQLFFIFVEDLQVCRCWNSDSSSFWIIFLINSHHSIIAVERVKILQDAFHLITTRFSHWKPFFNLDEVKGKVKTVLAHLVMPADDEPMMLMDTTGLMNDGVYLFLIYVSPLQHLEVQIISFYLHVMESITTLVMGLNIIVWIYFSSLDHSKKKKKKFLF